MDKLDISGKIDRYTQEVCKQTKFLRKLYREKDTRLWPQEYKTVDCERGEPQNDDDDEISSTKSQKSKPTSLLHDNDGEDTDANITDIDSEDSDDEDQLSQSASVLMKIAMDKKSSKKKTSDKEEMDADEESDDEEDSRVLDGRNYVNINVEQIDFSMPDKVVATKSMTLWLHLCDSWIDAMMSDPANLWLLEELYRDPLLAVYILHAFPISQYLAINMKKLFGVSNNNMPAERGLKYPKHAVGTYSHRLHLDTVSEYANINEKLLKQEINYRTDHEFNEVHFLVKSLIEIIGLQTKYDYCSALTAIYATACETVAVMQEENIYWSYVFIYFVSDNILYSTICV